MNEKYYITVVTADTMEEAPRILAKVLLPSIMYGQNYLAEKTNPLIAGWNEEYDKLYPDDTEDGFDPNGKYMTFFRAKQNEVLKDLRPRNIFVKRFYSGENCNLSLETVFGNYTFIMKEA